MYYIHYHNDFTVPISVDTISADMIDSIIFYTRKQGNTYCCSYDNKTLYTDEDYIYAVLNNHSLETGVLQYMVQYQLPDSNYPDRYQKVCKHFTTEIELTKDTGDLTIGTYQDYISELKEL